MHPLETAEENIRRLAFDATVILPYPEADAVKKNVVQCPNCSTKFCSAECLLQAEKQYHKLMCPHLQPNQSFDRINEIWK